MMLKNNINLYLNNVNNIKKFNFVYCYNYDEKKYYDIDNLPIYSILNPNVNTNLYYNFMIRKLALNFLNKRLKLKRNYYDKLKKSILRVKKKLLKLKNSKKTNLIITTCLGSGDKWLGVGKGEGGYFKKSYSKSINISKKYIYNLNFKCDDYRYLKYKGCKFRALNMPENRKNLKMYETLTQVSGDKKIKLISYSSKTNINIIKSLLNCF